MIIKGLIAYRLYTYFIHVYRYTLPAGITTQYNIITIVMTYLSTLVISMD